MAYASYNVSTTLEVVEAMVDFAQNLAGWTASMTSSDTGTFTAPGKDRSFTASSVNTGTSSSPRPTIYLDLTGTPPTGYERSLTYFRQITESYMSGTAGGPPSKVDLFGRASPTPFIVAAVETQPGSFRHLYMGYVEQFAPFSGGEIISGCPDPTSTELLYAYRYAGWSTPSLFEYNVRTSGFPSGGYSGGININGTFAKFRRSGLFVEGGPRRRSMLSPLRTTNAFSGYTPLNPINLYYGTESSTQDYWIPIGTPAGVRTLSMANFFPGQQVTLPDESAWRVYPLRKKGPNTNSIGNPETSGDYGFAFLMDD